MNLAPGFATRLEKAAFDNGFDQELGRSGSWVNFASSHAPLKVWLTSSAEPGVLVALSRADVAAGLAGLGATATAALPEGAAVCLDVGTIADLSQLLRRAYQLARTLPNELLRDFEEKTAGMPRATEAERLAVQRVGQDVFRAGLMDYWDGKCAITGLAVRELLRASHIKPWADCETDAERLDVFNGLLLAPHLDAAFDGGLITVADEGMVIVSSLLTPTARELLGLVPRLRVERLANGHRRYLAWHREREFRSA